MAKSVKEKLKIDWTKTADSLEYRSCFYKCRIVCYPMWGPVRICDEALKKVLSESLEKKDLKIWDMVFEFVPAEVLKKSDEGIVDYISKKRNG